MLALPVAAAQADATWTGASTAASWSDSTNWSGATPPTGSTGTLTFPDLTGCSGTCYTSNNNLGGVGATSLVLGNRTGQYAITGNGFTVGSGGINDAPGHGTGDVIKAPITLSGSQTWVVGSSVDNGYNSLTLLGGVAGPTSAAVTISTPDGDLFVDSDMEAGPVTFNGPGGLHIGGRPGAGEPGSINGSNGQPVTVNGGVLIPNPSSTTGPLTINGGALLLLGTNTNNTGTTTLDVNGGATLGSSTTTSMFINRNGTTQPGTDFSQLSATGDITVGGSLVLGQGLSNNNNTGSCVALAAGDVATLVTTTGTLSGTFSNAPDGATLTMTSSCQSTLPKVQIHYTSNSVTATVLGDTTTKLATPSPSPASTNETVTLTATVTATSTPHGAVAFSANGGTISGCASQPLTTSGSSGTATCTTSFPAKSSPQSLSAAFTPANGSGQGPSVSSTQSLTINPAATTTVLAASDTSPAEGTRVTYTATVIPAHTGATVPSGTVAFRDGATPISSCSAQPLAAGSSSSTATCTVSYSAAGSHTITAVYAGDPNLSGSSSPPATVAVAPAPTPSGGGSGGGSGPGGGSPGPGVGSGAPRGLVLSPVAQSHIRWREPHARPGTRLGSEPVGTRFSFSVSAAARVTFTFLQTLPGRRLRRRCVAPSRATRRARACVRSRTRGRLVRSVGAGVHTLTFIGRIGRNMLPSGSYSLRVTAVATSGARSRTRTLRFTIVG